jgi:beta-phosphoglucomutase-like phosphatase (HAD superfamily)
MERPETGNLVPPVIRALIYDFDDTIVESERINDMLFSGFIRTEYGISLSQDELDYLYGFAWSGVFEWLDRNKGLHEPRSRVWARFMKVKREYLSGRTLRVATGIDQMLALPATQAIVSGSSREEIRIMMESIGMREDSVRLILSDDDTTRGKPDPQGYLMALEKLGADARETVVFEDSPAGIQAARAAGIPVAFIAELASRDNASSADMRFPTFVEAWAVLKDRVRP